MVEKKSSFQRFKASLITIGLLLLAALLVRMWNEGWNTTERQTRFMMDTYVTVQATGARDVVVSAVSAALARMEEIAVKFNALDPRSPLYAFNHEGVPVTDREILGVIERGLDVSRATEGAFDMTVAPLSELWGFYGKSPHLPAVEDIKKALKSVGYQHLILKEGELMKDVSGVRVDLGGIAKGYALSEAVKILKARGIVSAMIDAGGDVYVLGRKGMRPWNVGIQAPRGDGLVGYVKVEDIAVMGSGDYERFFIQDGRRYHHIFDPKTGYPTEGVASVTVVYPDPVIAQAWAKAPFVLGSRRGLELMEKVPGMEVIVILSSGDKLFSHGQKHLLVTVPEP